MYPKHSNPTRADRTAHAPYNFVPLPEKVVTVTQPPGHDVYKGLSGRIDCRLTTKSPLYIRAGLTEADYAAFGETPFDKLTPAQQARRARFYFTTDPAQPVIPGSSLRGLIRTLVEIISFGKVAWVTDAQLMFRAVGDPSSLGDYYRGRTLGPNKATGRSMHFDYPSPDLQGGYLERQGDGWLIRPAQKHLGESLVHIEYTAAQPVTGGHQGGQRVYDVFVAPARRGPRSRGNLTLETAWSTSVAPRTPSSSGSPSGMIPGVLVESGHIRGGHKKHMHCVIYAPDTVAAPIPIPDAKWRTYVADRDMTRGGRTPTRKLQKDGDPLFYLVDSSGALIFFGPTMMFRLPYDKSPLDLVPASLRQPADLDFAEALFGRIQDTTGPPRSSMAGRVTVSDAVLAPVNQGDLWLTPSPCYLKILGSPKLTSFQHYLTQRAPNDKKALDFYSVSSPHDTVVRGHKLYWHRGPVGSDDIFEHDAEKLSKHSSQYSQVHPLRDDVTFSFEIHFENLRTYELGALLWALMLPGEPSHQYCQTIGMGKPLGMGVVEIRPTVYLDRRAGDKAKRYDRLFDEGLLGWYTTESKLRNLNGLLEKFEDFLLRSMHAVDRAGADCLCDVLRIRHLLALLEWPGPNSENTKYMGFGSAGLKEFRDRPVLPDSLAVSTGRLVGQSNSLPRGSTSPPSTSPTTHQRVRGIFRNYGENSATFGFIVPEKAEVRTQCRGQDVFVHMSKLLPGSRKPTPDDIVEFRLHRGEKGWVALDVVVVSG